MTTSRSGEAYIETKYLEKPTRMTNNWKCRKNAGFFMPFLAELHMIVSLENKGYYLKGKKLSLSLIIAK